MIHKQYNEIMANSKKKFSNLYSDVSSVKRILNGKGLIKYKDKFKNYEQ